MLLLYSMATATSPMTHLRRSTGKNSATVTFQDIMKVTMNKDTFLSNTDGKKRFLDMSDADCHTYTTKAMLTFSL